MPNAIDGKLKSNRPNCSKSALDDLLCPARYTPVECGVQEHPDGTLVLRSDIVKAIEFINGDDSCIHGRLRDLLENLEA